MRVEIKAVAAKPRARRNGTTCAIKVFRQVGWTGLTSTFALGSFTTVYGGWRYWCFVCNAYNWAGGDIGSSIDLARAHLAIHEGSR
jgi:hypothetical protein